MPTFFKITERLIGYATCAAKAGENVNVCFRELIGPEDVYNLQNRLENLHATLFSKIPSLPIPSFIDHLLVVINPDLSCVAYVNELKITAQVKPTRAITVGSPVYVGDISDVSSVNLGVNLPPESGIVLIRSMGWKRSLFFDFAPLHPKTGIRKYPIEQALAQQALLLLGISPSTPSKGNSSSPTKIDQMENGLANLKHLLSNRCEDEASYQVLLEQNPWMLGGLYSEIQRHRAFDDQSIPDFTAVRCYDRCHDIIELKQPFLKLFRKSDDYSSAFNDAWNQAERYLSFATQQRSYLREEKDFLFDNPRCLLLLGYNLSEQELHKIRKKEILSRCVSVFTYNHLVETATHIVSLMKTAHERTFTKAGNTSVDSNLLLKDPSSYNNLNIHL